MKSTRTVLAACMVCLAMLTVFTVGAAVADDKYPSKPIKLVVPYGPGGATDLAARVLISVLPQYLGQPVVVINKPGASGSICLDYITKVKPDGYTMLMVAIGSNALYTAMNTKLPFKYNDFTYVARTQINPGVTVINAKRPWKNFEEFKAAIKKDPSKIKFATAGLGTIQHLSAAMIYKALGIPTSKLVAVPYDSGTAAVLAVAKGEVDAWSGNLSEAVSSLRGGLVRPLAVTTPKRVKGFEQIPTYTELGLPQIDLVGFRGVAGPKGLPANVVKAWEDAVSKAAKSKPWIKLVKNLGDVPGYMDSKDFTAFEEKSFKRYRALFTELGLLIK